MPDSSSKCSGFCIPAHLHTLDRVEDNDFSKDEYLYRRIVQEEIDEDYILDAAFPVRSNKISVNRSHYCNTPKDVLYSCDSPNHFFNDGILQISTEIEGEEIRCDDNDNVYEVKFIHEPEECIYPHSVIVLFKGDICPQKIKPSSVKTKFRDRLRAHSEIIKRPD